MTKRPPLSLKRILVPIDFSDSSISALDYALGLAEKFGAKLTLLHVVEPVYLESSLMNPELLEYTNQNRLAAGRDRLLGLPAMEGLVAVETLVRMGRAQSEIADTAKATASDLIVMATHGHEGIERVALGGTTERVLRLAPCPVLVIRG